MVLRARWTLAGGLAEDRDEDEDEEEEEDEEDEGAALLPGPQTLIFARPDAGDERDEVEGDELLLPVCVLVDATGRPSS